MQTHFYLIVELSQHNQVTEPANNDWLADLKTHGCSGLMLHCDDPQTLILQWRSWQQRLTQTGLALHGVSLSANVHEADIHPQVGQISQLIQQLAGQNALVQLSLLSSSPHDKPSAPRADSRAAGLVRQLAVHARQTGTRLALLAQLGRWMQRVEDAARIAMRVNHPSVGLSLDGQTLDLSQPDSLRPLLQLALPRMWSLIVPDPAGHAEQVATLMRAVSQLGYQGPIGWRHPPGSPPPPAESLESLEVPQRSGPGQTEAGDWIGKAAANWQRRFVR